MKKTGKVILTLAIAIVLLVGTAATAFAEEPPAQGERPEQGERPVQGEKPEQGGRQQGDKALTRLFIQYDSDNLDTYLELKAEHMAFHEEQKDSRDAMREQAREEFMGILEALLDEEISVAEAREAFDALKENTDAFKEAAGEILDAKKAGNEELRDQMKDTREQIRAALDADEVDEAAMASLLGQTLTQLEAHLALDRSTAAQIDALRAEYFPE